MTEEQQALLTRKEELQRQLDDMPRESPYESLELELAKCELEIAKAKVFASLDEKHQSFSDTKIKYLIEADEMVEKLLREVIAIKRKEHDAHEERVQARVKLAYEIRQIEEQLEALPGINHNKLSWLTGTRWPIAEKLLP